MVGSKTGCGNDWRPVEGEINTRAKFRYIRLVRYLSLKLCSTNIRY